MQVYLIANTVTGQHYVGQTRWDFNTRYPGGNWHKWTHNRYLQSAAAKYGVESFRVTILVEGEFTMDRLIELEAQYMKEYKAVYPDGYNWKEAGPKGQNHYNHKEYELRDAYGNVYRVINLRQFCKKAGLKYCGMLNMVAGFVSSSQGYALSTTPLEDITNPDEAWKIERVSTGETFTVLRKHAGSFAKTMSIPSRLLMLVLRGKVKCSHDLKLKGTRLNPDRVPGKQVKYEGVGLVHEDGREAIIGSAYAFAKENDLERGVLYDVINGKGISVGGWRLKGTPDRRTQNIRRRGITVKLRNLASGEVIDIKNVSEFCRERGLNIDRMHNMLHGGCVASEGWTLPIPCGRTPRKKAVYIRLAHEDGRVVEGTTPKDIEERLDIMTSVSVGYLIQGKSQSVKGWRVTNVRYLNDSYSEIVR